MAQSSRNLIRMFVLMISRSSLIMDWAGSKVGHEVKSLWSLGWAIWGHLGLLFSKCFIFLIQQWIIPLFRKLLYRIDLYLKVCNWPCDPDLFPTFAKMLDIMILELLKSILSLDVIFTLSKPAKTHICNFLKINHSIEINYTPLIWCSGTCSDLQGIRTNAKKDGDNSYWILNNTVYYYLKF